MNALTSVGAFSLRKQAGRRKVVVNYKKQRKFVLYELPIRFFQVRVLVAQEKPGKYRNLGAYRAFFIQNGM